MPPSEGMPHTSNHNSHMTQGHPSRAKRLTKLGNVSKNRTHLDANFLDDFFLHRLRPSPNLSAKETQGKRRARVNCIAMKRPKTFFWFAGVATLAGLPVWVLLLMLY